MNDCRNRFAKCRKNLNQHHRGRRWRALAALGITFVGMAGCSSRVRVLGHVALSGAHDPSSPEQHSTRYAMLANYSEGKFGASLKALLNFARTRILDFGEDENRKQTASSQSGKGDLSQPGSQTDRVTQTNSMPNVQSSGSRIRSIGSSVSARHSLPGGANVFPPPPGAVGSILLAVPNSVASACGRLSGSRQPHPLCGGSH